MYLDDVSLNGAAPTAPAAPTGVSATAGNASAQVSWTAPSNGGSPITSYVVTPFIGSTRADAGDRVGEPAGDDDDRDRVDQRHGVHVHGRRHQRDRDRSGVGSVESGHTPRPGRPAAPTGVSATAGNASAQVSWTAPSNGGSPITSYVVTPFIGSTRADAGDGVGEPAGDDDDRDRVDQRHGVHVHRRRHQREWHRSGVGAVERGHSDRTDRSGGADGGVGDGGERVGAGELDGAVEWWESDHELRGDAVHRVDARRRR